MNRYKMYVASKVKHAPIWINMKDDLSSKYNLDIISTWIYEAEEGASSSYEDLTMRCFKELQQCDGLILYAADENEVLKGALMEVGATLALNKPVFYIGPKNQVSISRVFRCHPLWFDISDSLSEYHNISQHDLDKILVKLINIHG